jgi:ribosomal protein S2
MSLNISLEVKDMAKVPDIIPITDLRKDAATALNHVKSSKQPVAGTR